MSIIGKASDSTFDYSDWIQKDGQTRSQVISSILNSITVSESYEAFPGYRSSPDSYVVDVTYDSESNTIEFLFNDGNVIKITIKSNGDVDLSEYVTKTELDNKISELNSNTQWKSSVPTFKDINKKYPNPQDGWTVNVDDTDITYRYTGSEWIPISSNSIPLATSEVDGKMSKEDKSKLDLLKNYDDTEIRSELKNSVKYSEFDGGRKTIQLSNHDTISGVTTSGSGVNIAMVSKWDKVDLGSTQVEINLNGSNKRPTYNDSNEIALINDLNSLGVYSLGKVGSFNDIPMKLSDKTICTNASNTIITFVVSNSTYGDEGGLCLNIYTQNKIHQTLYWKNTIQKRTLTVLDGEVQPSEFKSVDEMHVFLPNKAIAGPKLFALTTESLSDDIKSAMTSAIYKEPITSSDLDECISKGFLIKEEVVGGHISIGWNGSAYTFTQVGLTSPKSDPSVKSIIISVSPEGEYKVIKNGLSSTIVTKSNISSLLEPYATQDWVNSKGYLTEHQDISGYLLKTDLATSSKDGVMSKEDKSKLDNLSIPTKVSELQNDSNYVSSTDVPEYSLNKIKSGHNVYNLDETKNGEVTKSYRFYSIPNDIQFNSCKFYDELTWLSELGTDTIEVDGENKSVSECTTAEGPYFMITYNDLTKLETSEDGSSVTHMELVMVAYSLKKALSSSVLTKSEASSYVLKSELEELVNSIISKQS